MPYHRNVCMNHIIKSKIFVILFELELVLNSDRLIEIINLRSPSIGKDAYSLISNYFKNKFEQIRTLIDSIYL